MSDFFFFRVRLNKEVRESLVVFVAAVSYLDSIVKGIRDEVDRNMTPRRIVFLGVGGGADLIRKKIKSDKVSDEELRALLHSEESDAGIVFLDIQESGLAIDLDGGRGLIKEELDFILEAGSRFIFKKRSGVVESNGAFHFLKPSGQHCGKFIRASNALVSGVEVMFLASSLLPYLKGAEKIYVDTSSISSLVTSALLHKAKICGDCGDIPIIESFESYAVFGGDFDFDVDEKNLVIISATTSGNMAKDLVNEFGFKKDRVITVFYAGLKPGFLGICDISSCISGPVISYPADECPLCDCGSKVVKIIGDQFLPETPRHELLVIKKNHLKKEASDFLGRYSGLNVLKIDGDARAVPGVREHFYVDVKSVFSEKNFEHFHKKYEKSIGKLVSVNLDLIVSLDDPASIFIAEKIKNWAATKGISPAVVKCSDLTQAHIDSRQYVIVVAGAITSGRSLLSVSRSLRFLKDTASIAYLVGFSVLPSAETEEQLVKDLCQGGYSVEILEKIRMPRFREDYLHYWKKEKNYLESVLDPMNASSAQFLKRGLRKLFNERLEALEGFDYERNNAFYQSPSGVDLDLRPNFVFWSWDWSMRSATHADVYWTIQSVLHRLRTEVIEKSSLKSDYHMTLISPVCFDRFNDGIIQAALVRSAMPWELKYSANEDFSRLMTDVIKSCVESWDSAQGEASYEFLMALLIGHIELLPRHMEELAKLSSGSMPGVMQDMLGLLAERCQSL